MTAIGVIVFAIVLAFAIFVWRTKRREAVNEAATVMTGSTSLPDHIQPFSSSLLRLPIRCVLVIGGFGIPLFFFAGLGVMKALEPPFTLFTLALPLLSFFFAFSYTVFDNQRIAKVFRLGKFVSWEFTTVHWQDVGRVVACESNRDYTTNLKIRTTAGQNVVFTFPTNSRGANSFKEIEKFFHKR